MNISHAVSQSLIADRNSAVNSLAAIVQERKHLDGDNLTPVKYWEIIADNLKKRGWSLGWVSAVDSEGRTIWIAAPEALKNMRWKPLRLGPRHYGERGGGGEM